MESDDCEDNETEELSSILKNAFGESSDSDIDEKSQTEELKHPGSGAVGDFLSSWERIGQINGLWLCRDFLSPDEQSKLLSAIHQEGWFSQASGNQAMSFGDLPRWASELSHTIREAIFLNNISYEFEGVEACDNEKEPYLIPSDILWREPLFDQLIVNKYEPGEGICAHVDLLRFQDGISIVSLESSCVMHFTPVSHADNSEEIRNSCSAKLPVLLTPGSLVLMWGEARYLWKHEINRAPGFQTWEGQEIQQRRRTSVTLRKLC